MNERQKIEVDLEGHVAGHGHAYDALIAVRHRAAPRVARESARADAAQNRRLGKLSLRGKHTRIERESPPHKANEKAPIPLSPPIIQSKVILCSEVQLAHPTIPTLNIQTAALGTSGSQQKA